MRKDRGEPQMNSREMAYSIIDQLGEEELQGVIALFRRIFDIAPHDDTFYTSNTASEDMQERRAAFERMKQACRYIPDMDDCAITKQDVSQLPQKYKGSMPTIEEIEAELSDSQGGLDA